MKAIILKYDEERHDYIVEDLDDDRHLVIKESQLQNLKERLGKVGKQGNTVCWPLANHRCRIWTTSLCSQTSRSQNKSIIRHCAVPLPAGQAYSHNQPGTVNAAPPKARAWSLSCSWLALYTEYSVRCSSLLLFYPRQLPDPVAIITTNGNEIT